MRVERVVVLNDYGTVNGGAAQVAIASAIGLARSGLSVDYVCGVGPVDPRLEAGGVRVHCLEQQDILSDENRARAVVRGSWNSAAAELVSAVLEHGDRRSTVVHVHGWTKSLSTSVFRAAERARTPLVVTMHDYFAACPNGTFYDHQEAHVCHRKAMSAACVAAHCDSRSYAQKVWRVARQGITQLAGNVPRGLRDVIYLSEFSRSILSPYFDRRTRWHVVGNPISVERAPRVTAEHNRAFLFLGRLTPEKGAEVFAAAASQAGVPARLAGAGPMEASLRERWPMLEALGWLSSEAAQRELANARALVFPSLWYETQGLVVQEALGRGVPVLVADGTAAAQDVREGHNGFVFQQGSAAALAEVMRCMDNDELVRTLSENAYQDYWHAPRTLEVHCSDLREVYQRVLEGPQGALAQLPASRA